MGKPIPNVKFANKNGQANKKEEPIFTECKFMNHTVNKIEHNKQNIYYISFGLLKKKISSDFPTFQLS